MKQIIKGLILVVILSLLVIESAALIIVELTSATHFRLVALTINGLFVILCAYIVISILENTGILPRREADGN